VEEVPAGVGINLTGCRNAPLGGGLKPMEYKTHSDIVLQIVTAIAVIAILLYVIFGPSL
jgi:hypothetical protein